MSVGWHSIAFSSEKMAAQNRNSKFRNALSWSVDREDVRETLYAGFGKTASIALGSTSPYYDEEMAKIVKTNSQYDPEGASRIFDELDLKDVNGDGVRNSPVENLGISS